MTCLRFICCLTAASCLPAAVRLSWRTRPGSGPAHQNASSWLVKAGAACLVLEGRDRLLPKCVVAGCLTARLKLLVRSRSSFGSIGRQPGFGRCRDDLQRISPTILFALLKISFDVAHAIRNVCKAYNRRGPGLSESIEACCFHLDRENPE